MKKSCFLWAGTSLSLALFATAAPSYAQDAAEAAAPPQR
jgi:hypothetical protein